MREQGSRIAHCSCIVLLSLLAFCPRAFAQTTSEPSQFSHKLSVGFFAEGMSTSSHIILGLARQREMIGGGAALTWRLLHRRSMELDWLAEARPLFMESDPTLVSFDSVQYGHVLYSPPIPIVVPGNLSDRLNVGVAPYAILGYSNPVFSRRWTYTGGASPFGLQLNGFTHSRLQPVGMVDAGFLLSTREIPMVQSSDFNFVFQFGGGVEWYRTPSQSILFEYRVQHFSNGRLGTYNPGVDGGLWNLTYRFGIQ